MAQNIRNTFNGQAYRIGNPLPDGWIVGNVSPATGKPVAFEPLSSALKGYRTWHEGRTHAKKLKKSGQKNARLPDDDELGDFFDHDMLDRSAMEKIHQDLLKENKKVFDTILDSMVYRAHITGFWSSRQKGVRNEYALAVYEFKDAYWHEKDEKDVANVLCVRDQEEIILLNGKGDTIYQPE